MPGVSKCIISAEIVAGLFIFALAYAFRSGDSIYRASVAVPLAQHAVIYSSSDGLNCRDSVVVFEVDQAFTRQFYGSPHFFRDCNSGDRCARLPVAQKDIAEMERMPADVIKDADVSQEVGTWLTHESRCRSRTGGGGEGIIVCLSPDSTMAVFRSLNL